MSRVSGIKTYHSARYVAGNQEKITPWFEDETDIVDYVGERDGTIREVFIRKGGYLAIKDAFGVRKYG